MELKKLNEAQQLTTDACDLLRAYTHISNAPAHALQQLQAILRQLVPSLAILRSFESNPSRIQRYDLTMRTFVQVVGFTDDPDEKETTAAPHLGRNAGTVITDAKIDVRMSGTETLPSAQESASADAAHVSSVTQQGNGSGQQLAAVAVPAASSASAASDSAPPSDAPITNWGDVVGCEEAMDALRQAVLLPLRFPQLFRGVRRPCRKILLYGPPGTGKTLLAHATAGELGVPLLTFSSADLLSKWVGESEKQVREIFSRAMALRSCVVFFDEIDAICGLRGSAGETEVSRHVKTELLLRLQDPPESVLVLAATNLPWDVDTAIRRRFDRCVYVGLPSSAARQAVITRHLRGVDHSLSATQVAWLVNHTERYSLADLEHVMAYASMAPLQTLCNATSVRLATDADYAARRVTSRECESHRESTETVNTRSDHRGPSHESIVVLSTPQSQHVTCSLTQPSRKRHRRRLRQSPSQQPQPDPLIGAQSDPRGATECEKDAKQATVTVEDDRAVLALAETVAHPVHPVVLHRHRGERGCGHTPRAVSLNGGNRCEHQSTSAATSAPSLTAVSAGACEPECRCDPQDGVRYVPCAESDHGALHSLPLAFLNESQLLLPLVTHEHFVRAVHAVLPSVTQEELQRYDQWRSQHHQSL